MLTRCLVASSGSSGPPPIPSPLIAVPVNFQYTVNVERSTVQTRAEGTRQGAEDVIRDLELSLHNDLVRDRLDCSFAIVGAEDEVDGGGPGGGRRGRGLRSSLPSAADAGGREERGFRGGNGHRYLQDVPPLLGLSTERADAIITSADVVCSESETFTNPSWAECHVVEGGITVYLDEDQDEKTDFTTADVRADYLTYIRDWMKSDPNIGGLVAASYRGPPLSESGIGGTDTSKIDIGGGAIKGQIVTLGDSADQPKKIATAGALFIALGVVLCAILTMVLLRKRKGVKTDTREKYYSKDTAYDDERLHDTFQDDSNIGGLPLSLQENSRERREGEEPYGVYPQGSRVFRTGEYGRDDSPEQSEVNGDAHPWRNGGENRNDDGSMSTAISLYENTTSSLGGSVGPARVLNDDNFEVVSPKMYQVMSTAEMNAVKDKSSRNIRSKEVEFLQSMESLDENEDEDQMGRRSRRSPQTPTSRGRREHTPRSGNKTRVTSSLLPQDLFAMEDTIDL